MRKKTGPGAGADAGRSRRIRDARAEIDAIDRAIVRRLILRATVVAKISKIRGVMKRDPKREREVIRNAVRLGVRMTREKGFGYTDRAIASIFRSILDAGGGVRRKK